MQKFLITVRYAIGTLTVYEAETDDVFHVMGEIVYRSFVKIDRIEYMVDCPEIRQSFAEHNVTIRPWRNKYEKGENR